MRIPLQLAVIFAICVAGEFLHRIVGIPLPGNIIGMVLLLALLCLKIIKPEQISGVSSFFLNHLALFFLPPSIAIMAVGDDVLSKWPLLLFLCIVFTLAALAVSGRCTGGASCARSKRHGQAGIGPQRTGIYALPLRLALLCLLSV